MQSYIFKNGIPTRDVMSGKRYIFPLDYRADSTFLSRSQLTTNIHWLCYCTAHLYVVFHFYNGMWSFWVEVICAGFFCIVYLYHLSRGQDWDHINLFNPAICVCLFLARFWIYNVICRWLFVLLILVELMTNTI